VRQVARIPSTMRGHLIAHIHNGGLILYQHDDIIIDIQN